MPGFPQVQGEQLEADTALDRALNLLLLLMKASLFMR